MWTPGSSRCRCRGVACPTFTGKRRRQAQASSGHAPQPQSSWGTLGPQSRGVPILTPFPGQEPLKGRPDRQMSSATLSPEYAPGSVHAVPHRHPQPRSVALVSSPVGGLWGLQRLITCPMPAGGDWLVQNLSVTPTGVGDAATGPHSLLGPQSGFPQKPVVPPGASAGAQEGRAHPRAPPGGQGISCFL